MATKAEASSPRAALSRLPAEPKLTMALCVWLSPRLSEAVCCPMETAPGSAVPARWRKSAARSPRVFHRSWWAAAAKVVFVPKRLRLVMKLEKTLIKANSIVTPYAPPSISGDTNQRRYANQLKRLELIFGDVRVSP